MSATTHLLNHTMNNVMPPASTNTITARAIIRPRDTSGKHIQYGRRYKQYILSP